MAASRRNYQPEEKVAIIRRHLPDGIPVSDLCDQYGMQPTQYYNWQKQFFENGGLAFSRSAEPPLGSEIGDSERCWRYSDQHV